MAISKTQKKKTTPKEPEMKYRYPQDSKLTMSVKTFNSKSAEEFLEKHEGPNRPKGASDIKRYAQLMANGEWALTHQGLALSTEDKLIDGQHRLEAVIYAHRTLGVDVRVKMPVVRGLAPSVFDILDQGRNRKAKDAFAIDGKQYPEVLEVAVRLHWIRCNAKRIKGTGKLRISEMQDHLDYHPLIQTAVNFIMEELDTPVKLMGVTPGYAAGLTAVMFSSYDEWGYESDKDGWMDICKQFWKMFVDDDVENPVRKCQSPRIVRKYIQKVNSSSETKLERDALVDLLVSSWNAFAEDIEVKGINQIKPVKGHRPFIGSLDAIPEEE